MRMENIRLYDLANLAIGTPVVGAVNFTALHTLLHAIIKHLHIQDVSAELPGGGTGGSPPSGGILPKREEKGQENNVERRILHMEKQLEAFNNLPSGLDLIERSKSGPLGGSGAVQDMWQMMQLKGRMEVNEEGVCKAMTVLQDLMLEINALKESQREVQDQLQKVTTGSDNLQHLSRVGLKTEPEQDIKSLQEEMEVMKTRLKNLEDKLEALCESLARRPETKDSQTSDSSEPGDDDISRMSGPAQVSEISNSDGPILTTSQGSIQAEDLLALSMQTPHITQDAIAASALEDTQIVSGPQHENDLTYPGVSMPQNTGSNPSVTNIDTLTVPGSPGVTSTPPPGAASEDHATLSTRVDALEKVKADRTELGLLQRNTDDLAKTVPDLQEKLFSLNKEMQDLRGDRDQLEQLQRAMDSTVTQHVDQKLEDTSQIQQQLGYLSAAIQDIERELKELRDKREQEKASMEQSSQQLQDQLDTLRGILTTMASSSSTLLAMSIPRQSDSCTLASTLAAETALPAQGPVTTTLSKEHLTCPACTIDIGKKVSKLVSQYEHLQKLVTDYTSREAGSKDLQEGRKVSDHYIQDTEVIGYIKNTMTQLQEECEHLNKTTKSLIQDHQQKQQHIDILYQAVDKLENKKADKELIGLEIDKADKRALESKVSRTHHDATTEHLSGMIQELLGKVNAQEQNWQRLLEKINVEMQNKLDRIEIDSLKNVLEERWRDLRQQLQEHPPQYEADEAAGIRKQLMTRFHCISCDRPVDMMTPGLAILTIPKIPGLPAHQSNRPYTALELNQVRQQSRRLKSGIYQARREASQLEMSINHLRRIHAHMRQEIARVQLHFGGSDKTSRKNISHHLQAHCATMGKLSKQSRSNQSHDHLPALGSVGYMTISRSCGGSHTMTSSQRRNTRFQASNPLEDPTGAGCREEVFILGQDGHLYRGRKGNHLPTAKPTDGKRILATHQKASGSNLKGKENLSGYSSAASSDIRCVHGKSTHGSEQPLPSIKGRAPPTCSQVTKSTRSSSAPSRTSQERLFSASRGRLHQQSV